MQIFFHFGDGETTVSEAPETLDPFDIVVIEDTIIAAVPLHVGYHSFLAVKLSVLIGHAGQGTGFFHGIHKMPPFLQINK